MRPTQKQNRARGRGRKPGGGGNNVNRVYESTGPEGKVRGTPQQIVDKYLSLARDAQTSGDRVVAENFLQHAEHYQRILLEAMGARAEQRRDPSEQDQPEVDSQDEDGGDDAEAVPMAVVESRQGEGGNGQRRNRRQPQQRPEVSGLTTIDADEPGGESLLVDAEDLSASQPRRRRRGPAAEDNAGNEQAETEVPSK